MSNIGSPTHFVRLLIADVHPDPDRQILDEDAVIGYLAMHGVARETAITTPSTVPMGTIRRAAADALDAIATSETLVGKVIRTQDLSTDGTKVAADLRRQAATLRDLAADDDEALDDDGSGLLEVVEFSPYPRTVRW